MRTALLPVLLIGAILLAVPPVTPGAHASEPDAAQALRDAKQREGELRIQLLTARLWADTNQMRVEHLLRFAESLLKQRPEVEVTGDQAIVLLMQQLLTLHEEVASLQARLRAEQQMHAKDATALRRELARSNKATENARLQHARARDAEIVAEHRLRESSQEVERLHWTLSRAAPRASVTRVLANIPAAHWLTELRAGDATRTRVALQVLAVLPIPSEEAVDSILRAVQQERSLLDAALPALVRIGKPAVQPLVAAGCGESAERTLDRGWLMHVLGSMGPAAKDALPWLRELAAGEGRKADQARRAIEKIQGK